jgi:hypothetical protein
VWLKHEPKPPKMKAFRKTATTVTELTCTLSSLTAAIDAPGHSQRRDLATNPRRLRSARLPVTTVTELTGTVPRTHAPSERWGHYGDWANRHSKLNDSRQWCSQSLKRNSETGRPYLPISPVSGAEFVSIFLSLQYLWGELALPCLFTSKRIFLK